MSGNLKSLNFSAGYSSGTPPLSYCEYITPSVPTRIDPCPSRWIAGLYFSPDAGSRRDTNSMTSFGGRALPLYHVSDTGSVVNFEPGNTYFTCTSSDQL